MVNFGTILVLLCTLYSIHAEFFSFLVIFLKYIDFLASTSITVIETIMAVSGKDWPRVVVIGDSITEQGSRNGGWVTLLAEALTRKCDVINRGFSGYTTRTTRVS